MPTLLEMMPLSNIKELRSEEDIRECAALLRCAFGAVAEEFGLTKESAPTNAAFTTSENLRRHLLGGMTLYGMFSGASLIGCVAMKRSKADQEVFYIERLAVAPNERHHGKGSQLLSFAIEQIIANGGATASIGLMDDNERLKNWYKSKGFVQHDCRRFDHLPFKVCFMSMNVGDGHNTATFGPHDT